MKLITVVVLTFNAEESLARVVESCRGLARRVVVVDSYSVDRTVAIAEGLGCEVVQHPFDNYSQQRNWAQEYVAAAPDEWLLHLDADEVLSPELYRSISAAVQSERADVDGYLMRRLSYFLGKPIRYGQINPSWHLRLFRAGKGFCEERLYDQHFVVPGATARLDGVMEDLQLVSIEKWIAAHNRWSTAEAQEAFSVISGMDDKSGGDRRLKASLAGDLRMKKRWLKNMVWYRSPLFTRAFVFFFWSYVIRLGFLDGLHGLVYHVLQSFWFRFTVDSKIYEMRLQRSRAAALASEKLGLAEN